MPTRRKMMEDALCLERTRLWRDLHDQAESDPWSHACMNLVGRIRDASMALGYPTPWLDVPPEMLNWYAHIENIPPLIYAEPVDWRDVHVEMEEFGPELQSHYRWDK